MTEKLHYTQVAVIVYMIQSGITLFSLPRILAEGFGRNGWVMIFVISAIVLLNLYLIALVYQKGKGQSVFTILKEGMPSFLLIPLYTTMIVVFSVIAVLIGKGYVLLVLMTMFPDININILLILYLVVVWFALTKGIYTIAKITVIFFFWTIWTIYLVLMILPEFEWARMTPFFFQGELAPINKGLEVYSAFLGFELVLFLIPYVQDDRSFPKAIVVGHLFTTMIYFILCFVGFGFYSFGYLLEVLYPTISVMKYIQTDLLERIEHFTFSFFLMKVGITSIFYYWVAIVTINEWMPATTKHTKLVPFFLILITFIFSLFFDIQREINEIMEMLTIPEIVFSFLFPLFLLVLIKKKERKKKEDVHV